MAILGFPERWRFWRKGLTGGASLIPPTHQLRNVPLPTITVDAASSHYAVFAAWALQYRASQQAKLIVEELEGDDWVRQPQHPAITVWERGNGTVSAAELMGAFWWSLDLDGNVIIRILRQGQPGISRSRQGEPTGWEVIPVSDIETRWVGDTIRYGLREGEGQSITDITDDVIHLRFGVQKDTRISGQGFVTAILDQLYLNTTATQYASTRLTNPPHADWIVGPDFGAAMGGPVPTLSDMQAFSAMLDEHIGINGRKILASQMPIKLTQLNPALNDMALRDMMMRAEYAVASGSGIDPDDLQFQAGLQDSHSFSSVVEARRKTWQDGLLPPLNLLAAKLTQHWLTEFENITDANRGEIRIGLDLSDVQALQPDPAEVQEQIEALYMAGIITLDEARTKLGWPPLGGEEGDSRKGGGTPVDEEGDDENDDPFSDEEEDDSADDDDDEDE